MKSTRIKIKKTTFGFVFKTRFEGKNKKPVTWDKWRFGLFFEKSQIVGEKDFDNTEKWKDNLVNLYVIGFDLIVIAFYMTWNTGGNYVKTNQNPEGVYFKLNKNK